MEVGVEVGAVVVIVAVVRELRPRLVEGKARQLCSGLW
jgi:hypothetical protein